MKKQIIPIALGIVYAFAVLTPCSASEPEQYGAWWVKNHGGALTPQDHPLVARAETVFERVLAVADKKASRYPNLVIIPQSKDPWAISLKDGTIILTQKGLEICYLDKDKKAGDARLAFVLGHELAHLAKDDFLHLAAFEAVKKFGVGRKAEEEILCLFLKTEDIDPSLDENCVSDLADRNKLLAHAQEVARKKELQADGYSLLYAQWPVLTSHTSPMPWQEFYPGMGEPDHRRRGL
ncbi:M48 family metalloprotease [Desulfococcaceae bacterium HSG9]|nr:M48 family metalloprotease [Desulfococcaceae bacterium HSG9]